MKIAGFQSDVVKLVTSSGSAVATYEYDAWGNILSKSGTMADKNPLRYRGYYYDSETGFYYLQSRYYDPANRRIVNADCYESTGQGFVGTNMFAYCGNNPCSRIDNGGLFWDEIWEFFREVAAEVEYAAQKVSYVYAGFGAIAVADGPLPICDAIAATGAVVLSIGLVGYGVVATVAGSRATEEERAEAATATKRNENLICIYRYNGTNPGNLVPSVNDVRFNSGLSFSMVPRTNSWCTTIEDINSTGVLHAVKDGTTHVSAYPIGGTIKEWRAAGASSRWPQALIRVSVKIKWNIGEFYEK